MYHLRPATKKPPLSYLNPQAESSSNKKEDVHVSLKFLIESLMHLRRRLWSNTVGMEKPNGDHSMQVLLKFRGGGYQIEEAEVSESDECKWCTT
jgi:hypothetical protein